MIVTQWDIKHTFSYNLIALSIFGSNERRVEKHYISILFDKYISIREKERKKKRNKLSQFIRGVKVVAWFWLHFKGTATLISCAGSNSVDITIRSEDVNMFLPELNCCLWRTGCDGNLLRGVVRLTEHMFLVLHSMVSH